MRIAIFGAAGRTGRLVCDALAARGHALHPVTRRAVPGLPGTPERADPADAAAGGSAALLTGSASTNARSCSTSAATTTTGIGSRRFRA